MTELIEWPTGQKLIDTISVFERMKGFLGVVGAIDGTHIPIKAPKENPNDYNYCKFFHFIQLQAVCDADLLCIDAKENPNDYNYCKFFHFIQLQAVCDADLPCIDAFCGFPRRVHDAHVFHNSPLLKMQEVVQMNCFQVTCIFLVILHIPCRNGYRHHLLITEILIETTRDTIFDKAQQRW